MRVARPNRQLLLWGSIALGVLFRSVPSIGSCAGDTNQDGVVTIEEIVGSVREALFGCADQESGLVRISLTTDKVRYRSGETAQLRVALDSSHRIRWWSEYPFWPELQQCVLNLVVSRGHFSTLEVVYERGLEASLESCRNYDGGPARVKGIHETPPTYKHTAELPLVANVGERAGQSLEPGIYLVEAVLALGRIPEGGDQFSPPFSPPMKAAVLIEVE